MPRASVVDIAKLVDLHPNTLRRWTDRGLIKWKETRLWMSGRKSEAA